MSRLSRAWAALRGAEEPRAPQKVFAWPPAFADGSLLRVGDPERSAAVLLLDRFLAAGYFPKSTDLSTYGDRSGVALEASTRADLALALDGLPHPATFGISLDGLGLAPLKHKKADGFTLSPGVLGDGWRQPQFDADSVRVGRVILQRGETGEPIQVQVDAKGSPGYVGKWQDGYDGPVVKVRVDPSLGVLSLLEEGGKPDFELGRGASAPEVTVVLPPGMYAAVRHCTETRVWNDYRDHRRDKWLDLDAILGETEKGADHLDVRSDGVSARLLLQGGWASLSADLAGLSAYISGERRFLDARLVGSAPVYVVVEGGAQVELSLAGMQDSTEKFIAHAGNDGTIAIDGQLPEGAQLTRTPGGSVVGGRGTSGQPLPAMVVNEAPAEVVSVELTATQPQDVRRGLSPVTAGSFSAAALPPPASGAGAANQVERVVERSRRSETAVVADR